MPLFAQVAAPNFWTAESGSVGLYARLIITFLVGIGMIGLLMMAPTRLRRTIVGVATFLAGAFYVIYYLWPAPVDRKAGDLPTGAVESVSFWLGDALTVVANFSSILSGFLLGLGIYSLLRVHLRRISRQQRDWGFSIVLLVGMVAMLVFGFGDWFSRLGPNGSILADPSKWGVVNKGQDLLFDGLFQQMDAAMFSLIAFYILSAAYRAFRVRSVEATILLATALIMMLSLLGAAQYFSGQMADALNPNPDAFIQNFTLSSVAAWIGTNLQTPSIRAIDFGIGLGALAMGLRLWLSLERGNSG
jgi:hypothetical protein